MTREFKSFGKSCSRMQLSKKKSSDRKGRRWRWLMGAAVAWSIAVIGQLPDESRIKAAVGNTRFKFKDSHKVSATFRGDDSATRALESGQAQSRSLAAGDLDGNGTPELVGGYSNGAE